MLVCRPRVACSGLRRGRPTSASAVASLPTSPPTGAACSDTDTAVVIGGSLAGLLSAAACSRHFQQVIVLDRDAALPLDTPAARTGVPQSTAPHALLTGGLLAAEKLLPGLDKTLEEAGAVRLDWCSSAFQVNASGRGSRAADWLAAAGVAEPCVTETVDGGVCYATRYYTFPEGAPLPPFTVLQVSASPPDQQRIGYLALLENRRMVATLGSYGRSLVPLDEDGWTAFAESLPGGGAFARGLEHAVPETTGKNCAQQLLANANLRRTYPLVPGLVHVGDARLALCPVYGQGITMAALGATSLASALGDATEATKSGRFATVADALHAAKYDGDHPAAAQGWALAAGTDAGFPHAAAKAAARAAAAAAAGGEVAPAPAPPAAAALPPPLRAFFAALRRTAGRDAAVWATFNGVAHLTKPITALFHPAIVGRVAVAEVKRVLAGRT